MMIKGIIFDFDGLIVDTETPDYLVWRRVYAEHGEVLTLDLWGSIIGGTAASTFKPCEYLEARHPAKIDCNVLRKAVFDESLAAILQQPVLPGVWDAINTARRLGLSLAIASSSPHSWVDAHLQRLGLFDYFDRVICRDDVGGISKPDPALFNRALADLNLRPSEAIVFEDSPNGVLAARRAGIYVVAVPNFITRQLDLSLADLVLSSLEEMSLEEIISLVEQRK